MVAGLGGGAMLPLPWTAVDAYARRHGIAGENFDMFWRLIGELDAEYLDWHATKRKAEADGDTA